MLAPETLQDFLDWYFKYDRMMLPLDYNTVPEVGARHTKTLAGNPLKIVHFTRDKPFFRDPRVPLHSLLTCAKAKVCAVLLLWLAPTPPLNSGWVSTSGGGRGFTAWLPQSCPFL